MESKRDTYVGIDFIKLLASLMVVMIHSSPFLEFGAIGSYTAQIIQVWGVPFFFCCSGFFLAVSLQKKKSFPWKQIKRLFIFYCIWTIIYMPFMPIDINNFFLKFFIYGSVFHLWYISALIFNIILISLIRNNKALIILGVLFFILGVLGSSYYVIGMKIPIVESIIADSAWFDRFRRIFCIGLPFTVLGYIMARKKDFIGSFVKTRTVQLVIVAIFLFLAEMAFILYFRLERDVFITCFLMPLVAAFFLGGLFFPVKNSEGLERKGYICRLISNCVYFVHPLVLYYIVLRIGFLARFPTLVTLTTFFVSALIGYIIIKINNRYLNRLIQ